MSEMRQLKEHPTNFWSTPSPRPSVFLFYCMVGFTLGMKPSSCVPYNRIFILKISTSFYGGILLASEINLSFSFNSLYFFGVQKPNASRYYVEIFFFFQMQLKSFQAHSHLPAANKVELRPNVQSYAIISAIFGPEWRIR